ncbi:hypothetical protein MMC29_003924 [Sticta canariensis]|nr:hypothetical protein [Sticta canariensis]
MSKLHRSTLVKDMANLRSQGFNANHFIDMVLWKRDPSPTTGLEKVRFLTFGSPALRFILYQVHTYVLPQISTQKPNKLLLTEDIPLPAQFWEMCLNLVYVESAVLHAGLSDTERVGLVARFNDPEDSLVVLVIMHSVSSQEVNLDGCCHRVPVQDLLVALLNESNDEVKRAHAMAWSALPALPTSPHLFSLLPAITPTDLATRLFTPDTERLPSPAPATPTGTCRRIRPNRYGRNNNEIEQDAEASGGDAKDGGSSGGESEGKDEDEDFRGGKNQDEEFFTDDDLDGKLEYKSDEVSSNSSSNPDEYDDTINKILESMLRTEYGKMSKTEQETFDQDR